MIPHKQALSIIQGATFDFPVHWETSTIEYTPITGITQTAPAVVTATAHGVPDGWRVAIVSCKGMTKINAENDPPKDSDYIIAKVLTADTIELNTVNASEYKAWVSGGYVQCYIPQDLTSYTARMSIKDKLATNYAHQWRPTYAYALGANIILSSGTVFTVATPGTSDVTAPTGAGTDGTVVWAENTSFVGGKELMSLTTENGRIDVDNTTKTITLTISADDTAAIAWKKGIYDLELESPLGVVTALMYGAVTVTNEVTVNV